MELDKKIKGILEGMRGKKVVLIEELHSRIKDILNDEHIHPKDKNNYVTGLARQLIAAGEDSGLEDAEPKTGSSRAVYFPKEHRRVRVDNVDTLMPTAVKVAFPGWLDAHQNSGMLLGEHQNAVESDPEIIKHSVLVRQKDGSFKTNPNGILVPHVDSHVNDHWLEVGRVQPLSQTYGDAMREHTKTDEFPRGIGHRQFSHVMEKGWDEAHGEDVHWEPWEEELARHPLIKKAEDLVANTNLNPGDFTDDNMGIWTHPLTGEKHIVIHDYGYSNDVAKHYYAAKANRYNGVKFK